MGDIYQEINQKLAEYDQILNDHRLEMDNKANIDNINELLNSKANKRTVAEALHRKASKEEIEKILSSKIPSQDLDSLLSQLHSKANISDLHHLQEQIESKISKKEVQDLLQAHSSPSKSENPSSSLLNTLQREKEYNTSKIENLELMIKGHVKKIDNELKTIIDNFNLGLGKKADFRDLEGIGHSLSEKADMEIVSEMVADSKERINEKIVKIKDDFNSQRKAIYEEIYERYNKQGAKVEKLVKDLKGVKESSKEFQGEAKKIRADVKEIIYKEAEMISSQVREEINKAIDELHTARIKIDHEMSQKVKKGDLLEFRNEINELLEPKVEGSEVQKALNNLQTDLANRLVNTKLEIQNNMTTSQEKLSYQLSKK